MPSLLSIENLKVSLHNPQTGQKGWVLRGIDLTLEPGESLAVVGESGCGKSMTALSILHLLPQPPMEWAEGKIFFKGRDLSQLDLKGWNAVRGREIGIVFQEPFTSLNPVFSVGQQIEETLRVHLGLSGPEAKEKVFGLFKEVGLADPERIYGSYPHQLSGGM